MLDVFDLARQVDRVDLQRNLEKPGGFMEYPGRGTHIRAPFEDMGGFESADRAGHQHQFAERIGMHADNRD